MKTFIAITCFALVAVAFGEETSVPPSVGGSLLRTKSGLLNNAADRWDRWMQGFRGLVPFGQFNVGINTGVSTTAKPTTTTSASSVSSSTISTGSLNITGPVGVLECARKSFVQKQLNETIADVKASKDAIDEPTTGLKKALTDANALTIGSGPPVVTAGDKTAAILKASTELAKEEQKLKFLEWRQQQLNGQLEVYAVCKD